MIVEVTDASADLEPLEGLGSLALVQGHLLGALVGRCRLEPFPNQVRGQDYRPAVVNVDYCVQGTAYVLSRISNCLAAPLSLITRWWGLRGPVGVRRALKAEKGWGPLFLHGVKRLIFFRPRKTIHK